MPTVTRSAALQGGIRSGAGLKPGATAPSVLRGSPISLWDRIQHRRALGNYTPTRVPGNEYMPLDRIEAIIFDPKGLRLPERPERDYPLYKANYLDWNGAPDAPYLAVSKDDQDLLIVSPCAHPPDHHFDDDGTGEPRDFPQRYSDRTEVRLGDWSKLAPEDRFLLIQPVAMIGVGAVRKVEVKERGVLKVERMRTWLKINCAPEPRPEGPDGTRMAFLVNPETGEAHLVGGRFVIGNPIEPAVTPGWN